MQRLLPILLIALTCSLAACRDKTTDEDQKESDDASKQSAQEQGAKVVPMMVGPKTSQMTSKGTGDTGEKE